jgi:tetratricopeptide (TPR) repeat protein
MRDDMRVSLLGLAFLGSVAAVVAWTAISIGWSISIPRTVSEIERGLIYVSGVTALLVLARSRAALLAGALAGVTLVCVDALVLYRTSQAPDRFEGTLLFRPVGYANGLAALAAIGLPLALWLSVRMTRLSGRALAAASASPLAAVLVLTHSTGAYFALSLSLALGLLLEQERIAFAGAAAPAIAASAAAAGAAAAFGPGAALLLPCLGAAALVAAFWTSRLPRPRGWIVVLLVMIVVAVGFPAAVLGRGLALGDRPEYWRAGLAAYAHSPVAGTGGGTFALDWLANRDRAVATRDAHSLEVEAVAELGPIGLLLVLTMLAIPIVGAVRRRNDPLVPAAAAAYLVLAVHAGLDWDWEQPAVWLAGMTAAVVLVTVPGGWRLPAGARWTAAALLVAVALMAAVGLRGNQLVAHARAALRAGRPERAASVAAQAAAWQPWASEPLVVQEQADLALGNRGDALALIAKGLARDPNDPSLWLALASLSRPPVAQAARATAARFDPVGVRDRAP